MNTRRIYTDIPGRGAGASGRGIHRLDYLEDEALYFSRSALFRWPTESRGSQSRGSQSRGSQSRGSQSQAAGNAKVTRPAMLSFLDYQWNKSYVWEWTLMKFDCLVCFVLGSLFSPNDIYPPIFLAIGTREFMYLHKARTHFMHDSTLWVGFDASDFSFFSYPLQ
jgi:hypothetical protein